MSGSNGVGAVAGVAGAERRRSKEMEMRRELEVTLLDWDGRGWGGGTMGGGKRNGGGAGMRPMCM
jgi:hypothetical protein